MRTIYEIICDLAYELPPERIRLLSEKITELESLSQMHLIRPHWGANVDEDKYAEFVNALKTSNMTSAELSVALKTAIAVVKGSERKGEQELVWTGPATSSVPVRSTERVLCELINAAKTSLFLVSFVVYNPEAVIAAVKEALRRNVRVDILLDDSTDEDGKPRGKGVNFLTDVLPQAKLWVWDAHRKDGLVHAKCAVADQSRALITSANLTDRAMETNMEMGILLKGGPVPKQLKEHLQALIVERVIVEAIVNKRA